MKELIEEYGESTILVIVGLLIVGVLQWLLQMYIAR